MKIPFAKILFHFLLLLFVGQVQANSIDSLRQPELWLEKKNEEAQQILKVDLDFDRAVVVFKEAIRFAEQNGLKDKYPDLVLGYGNSLYKNGDIQNAYKVLSGFLPVIDESDLKTKAIVNKVIGMCLVFQNNYTEGYRHQMDALKYYSDINDTRGLISVYYDMGSNFHSQEQGELAMESYKKGIKIAENLGDTKLIILGNTSIGATLASMGDYEGALQYNDKSIQLSRKINDTEELAWASINRGHLLGLLGRYDEAISYLNQSRDISNVIGNKLLSAYSLEQMADIHISQNRLQDAMDALEGSYKSFKDLGQTNSLKNILRKRAEIAFKKQDYVLYKQYTEQYIGLKDSLYSEEMMASMSSLKESFEVHKVEREKRIALLEKDKELADAKNYTTIIFTGGAIISFILLLLLMYSRNKAAADKNAILTAKNKEIIRQNEFLANSNRDLEKFAYIISHDLKEPLRNINGFTKLLMRKLKKLSIEQEVSEYAKFITGGTKQMEDLLIGLLEYSKVNANKSKKERIKAEKLVGGVLDSLRIQLHEKQCEVEVGALPEVLCRQTQLVQVFQNLIANAIKFGPDSGNKITIKSTELDDEHRFMIKDNGIGIEPEFQKDIFVVFKRLHPRGTYAGSGIGLATCKKIIDDHGGRIWVESEPGHGAAFFFTIPKNARKDIFSDQAVPETGEIIA